MMKHIIQKLFILSLATGLLAANASAMSFPDVDTGAWYSDAVGYVSELGVMIGDTEGNFNPGKPVTRAEMAAVICRTLEETLSEEEYMPAYLEAENFSDVPASHWANGCINKVSALGIASGYGNGRFGPSDYLTYEQAITMIVRMVGAEAEASELGGYPNGFLEAADNLGLLSGIRSAKGEKFSRANVAVLLYNYLHGGVNGNPPADENTAGSDPAQDDQNEGSLEIGDSPQEDQPVNGPAADGTGGGT